MKIVVIQIAIMHFGNGAKIIGLTEDSEIVEWDFINGGFWKPNKPNEV